MGHPPPSKSSDMTGPGIDWEALWAQLDWDNEDRLAQATVERLKQRAKQYAQAHRRERAPQENAYQVLAFTLGMERYAVDVQAVRGVRALGNLTRVPGVPDFYRGVINVRGQILTVLDLRAFFNTALLDHIPRELVLVSGAGLDLALLADHVEEILIIPPEAIEPVEMAYTRGVTMGRLVVLDIEKLLTDDRLIVGGGGNHDRKRA